MVDIRYPIETKESLTLLKKDLEKLNFRLEAISNDPILRAMTVKDGIWEDSFHRLIKHFLSNLSWFTRKLCAIIDQIEPTRKRRSNAKKSKFDSKEVKDIQAFAKPSLPRKRKRSPNRES